MSGATLTPSARYRSVERLATGGMGEVELAVRREGQFRRLYAVKRLLAEMRGDPYARSMFLDEARLAGLVRHPNVVSVLDVGEDDRGPFLVMDFVEGISAGALLTWATENAVTLPVQLCLRIVREIALGLHAAHELTDHDGQLLGLVHRDVSPQNILIGFDGISRIADFGIAKAMGRTTKTTTGLLKGKAGYMAPEQLRFEDPDRRSDIFSLGVVLYELLASQRLYKSESDVVTARRILNEPPPDIDDAREDAPPEIVELLFSALAKSPTTRPATAQLVAQRLERCIAGLVETEGALDVGDYVRTHFAARQAAIKAQVVDIQTRVGDETKARPTTKPRKGGARRRWVIAAVISAAAVVVVGSGLAFIVVRDANERASAAERGATVGAPPGGAETSEPGSGALPAPVHVEGREASMEARPTAAESATSGADGITVVDPTSEAVSEPEGETAAARRRRAARARRARMRPAERQEQLFMWE